MPSTGRPSGHGRAAARFSAAKRRVVFPSCWDESRGGDNLRRMAFEVIAAVGHSGEVDSVAISGGDRADEAARLGLTPVPKMPKEADVAQAVLESLTDPPALSSKLGGPEYVLLHDSVAIILPKLEAGYAKVLENAR